MNRKESVVNRRDFLNTAALTAGSASKSARSAPARCSIFLADARPMRSSKRDPTECTTAASARKPKSKLRHTFSHFA